MKKAKTSKHKEWHASNQKIGMGDSYGSGVRQKVGTIREDFINGIGPSPKKTKPPRSLA